MPDPEPDTRSRTSTSLSRSAISLGLIALLGTALLAFTNQQTRERIAEQERRVVLKQLEQVFPADAYNNDMHDDRFSFQDSAWFPSQEVITVYRARSDDSPAGVVFSTATLDGYNGRINLLIGILDDGTISGVRVTSHKETPGLGDAIELRKSDWILGFNHRSLENPPPEKWAVKRNGGVFDQLTGATITPRAIVNAVKRTLEYFESHQSYLYQQSPGHQPVDARNIDPAPAPETTEAGTP